MITRFEVDEESQGLRLDTWLADVAQVTRSAAAAWITSDHVTVDGGKAIRSLRVKPGMVIVVSIPEVPPDPSASALFELRFEDDYLAVVSKPFGVVVHPGHGNETGTLVQALSSRMTLAGGEAGRPGIVHRLDKDTSGLMVVAKTIDVFDSLGKMIKDREVSRVYTSLVAGVFALSTGRVEAPVGRSTRVRTRMAVDPGGRSATTEFSVIRSFDECSLLEILLETGRTHQIRVHMSHIDHPVVGDRTYGRNTMGLARRIGLRRMFLHASRLSFLHPITGVQIAIDEPLPPDLEDAVSQLRNTR